MKKKYLILLLITLPLILLTLAGCAGKSVKTGPEKGYIFYPPLPTTPRYQYLTTFSTSKDIQKKKSKFFKFIAGDETEKPKSIVKAYGVAIYQGVIYVCDVSANTVVTLNLKTQEFGYLGTSGPGRILQPINIFVDKKHNELLITDMQKGQVLVYSPDGRYLRAYGKVKEFKPSDVEVYQEKVFICDVKAHQVIVLDRETGKLLNKIGKPGSAIGRLYHPTNICIHNDRLYVSETSNFRVQIFDLEGKSLDSVGKIGDVAGTFTRNKGIAVDNEERLYVVDSAFQNVQVFNREKQLLLYLLGPGPGRDSVVLPAAITIDYDNLEYFKQYISPRFKAEYLIFVTSNFGANKVNVYAFGEYQK